MSKQRLRVGVTAIALVLALAMAVPGHAAPIAPQPISHGAWTAFIGGLQHQLAGLLGLGGPRVNPPVSGRHAPAPQAATQSTGGNNNQPTGVVLIDPNGNS
jgi:hypothetical protein